MKSTLFLAAVAVAAFASSCASSSHKSGSSGDGYAAQASAPNEQEMMKKWQEFATPGEAHQRLNGRVGRWTAQVKGYEPGSSEPNQVSTGTSEVKWIMDGRYVQDTTTGVMMGNMPFNGLGTLGYDNIKKCYVGTWIDNMGTGVMVSEGKYDAATDTFHYKTSMPDMMTGKYVQARSTEHRVDADHWTMEMFMPGPDGKEYKCLQIDYTRG